MCRFHTVINAYTLYTTSPSRSSPANYAYASPFSSLQMQGTNPEEKVIIGPNGSGKSTILKLIARIYDPDEGQILIDGHDIQKLNLDDLRATISVLFQDYTHFPLSVRPSSLFPLVVCRVGTHE